MHDLPGTDCLQECTFLPRQLMYCTVHFCLFVQRHAIPTEAAAAGREPVQLTGPPGPDTAAHQPDPLGALDGSIRGNVSDSG